MFNGILYRVEEIEQCLHIILILTQHDLGRKRNGVKEIMNKFMPKMRNNLLREDDRYGSLMKELFF